MLLTRLQKLRFSPRSQGRIRSIALYCAQQVGVYFDQAAESGQGGGVDQDGRLQGGGVQRGVEPGLPDKYMNIYKYTNI